MATPAIHQEVVKRIVIDPERHQSSNGWRAENDGSAKRVLARELTARQRSSWPHAK